MKTGGKGKLNDSKNWKNVDFVDEGFGAANFLFKGKDECYKTKEML